jgi:hypothetical protein
MSLKQSDKILHPLFIGSLSLLLINDFYLKAEFGNFLTGKISDFVGLFVFAVFWSQVFPKTKNWISLLTGIGFIIWKTPLVTPLIEIFNEHSFFTIQRVIDYSDYMALIVLPFSHRFIRSENNQILIHLHRFIRPTLTYTILGISFFAICATTLPLKPKIPDGTVYIGKKYRIKESKSEILKSIQSLGYNTTYYDRKSEQMHHPLALPYYQTDTLIVERHNFWEKDTIYNVKYRFYETNNPNKTKVEIINVTFNTKSPIQQINVLKRLRRKYKKEIKKLIIDRL